MEGNAVEAYFYGWWGNHYCPALWTVERKIIRFADVDFPPSLIARIDGGFCPGSFMLNGALTLPEPNDQVEGLVRVFYAESWTAVALWDRSVVDRPGSHATVLLRGHWEDKMAVKFAEVAFPDVWARLPEVLRLSPV